jgi:hypothetical protein
LRAVLCARGYRGLVRWRGRLLLDGVRLGRAGSRRDWRGGGAGHEMRCDVGEFGPPEKVGVAEVAVVGDLLEVAACAVIWVMRSRS